MRTVGEVGELGEVGVGREPIDDPHMSALDGSGEGLRVPTQP
jgi:hypothetical protein